LTQAGYWFILRFCEHFSYLSSKIQNAIKLENISNLITSPSSYQCIRSKNMKVSAFSGYSWPTHINGMYVCVLGIPKCKFSKQMIKKYLITEYLFITEGKFFILRTLKIRYMPVFCLFTLGRHGNFTAGDAWNSQICCVLHLR
jgi:hypothetical protein